MFTVRALLLCQRYEVGDDGQVDMVLLDGATAPAFPFGLPIKVVAVVDATEDDLGSTRPARLELERPDGSTGPDFPEHEVSFTRSLGGVAVHRSVHELEDVVFEEAGPHWLRLYVDGLPVARAPLFIDVD